MMVISGVVADEVVVDVETITETVMVAIIVMAVEEVLVPVIVVVEKDSILELLSPRPSMTINGEKNRTICKFA